MASITPVSQEFRVYRYAWVMAAVWTLTVLASLGMGAYKQRQNTVEMARAEARAAFEKDQAYRNWNRSLGGVYVETGDTVQPSPYLAHIPERDIVTPSGKRLTLINSSYMTRLVHEHARERYGIKGHVTSLRPIRPENSPDAWETAALRAFERGAKEVSEELVVDGEPHVRLMQPLVADKTCIKCHAAYGTREGEVRGGISVVVPLSPLLASERALLQQAGLAHAVFWLFGLAAIGLGSRRISRQMALRLEAERSIRERDAHIEYLSNHDGLTRLPNRTLLQDRLHQALGKAHRNNKQLALLLVDLDRFKNINDTLGHEIGDLVLVKTTERLLAALRDGDTLARLGGDEFAILLDEIDDPVLASSVAGNIQTMMEKPFQINGRELYCACSIGITLYPTDGGDVDSLFKHADIAMYQAKEKGRACYQFYSSYMNIRTERRLALEHGLRLAVSRNELVLHYQPQIDIASGQTIGVEALVRWQHPEFGLIPPAEFIPIAEADGSIVVIGDWILRQACEQAAQWNRMGTRVVMAVNLSARQFWQRDLAERIEGILHESGLPPPQLDLEVTESVVMNDAEAAKNTLRSLARLGAQLSIDDFGTGYSSLAYLKDFPIRQLKVDRSFVADIGLDLGDTIIVSAIIGLARNLGLQVVAEGVETAEQLEWLRQEGCHVAQGFYFSKPVPADQLFRPES